MDKGKYYRALIIEMIKDIEDEDMIEYLYFFIKNKVG